MNESLMTLLNEVSAWQLIVALFLVFLVAGFILSQIPKITKLLQKWRKKQNDEEDFKDLVYSMKADIKELSNRQESYRDERHQERTHDRNDSIRVREEIYKEISTLNTSLEKQGELIQKLTDITLGIQEANSETKRAELKEKIERIYHECSPSQMCTDMQLETLKELIHEYEKHGGTNSFVHSTVEPEMYKWEVIEYIKRIPK